jgi:hypothetical protein
MIDANRTCQNRTINAALDPERKVAVCHKLPGTRTSSKALATPQKVLGQTVCSLNTAALPCSPKS